MKVLRKTANVSAKQSRSDVFSPAFLEKRLCPVCKSEEIILDTAGHTGKYRCKKCGYIGALILEKDD